MALHDNLYPQVRPGDRIVYLGNYHGFSGQAAQTIDEILTFRRHVLALPGMMPKDIVYLRGGQEEMWEKLQQLQFATDPSGVLRWMLERGMAGTLESYGLSPKDGICAAREGVMSIVKWTRKIREAVRRRPGHDMFTGHLRRAAFTDPSGACPLLFVHAGIDPEKPLSNQGDNFWWTRKDFKSIALPYQPFQKVIRGFDPDHGGLHINCVTATIDGGCGFGGPLICAGFDAEGSVFDIIEI